VNWDAIAAVGQAVSALALVFVIVQIRHARAEAQRALSQGRAEGVRDILSLATDERVNRLVIKANSTLGTQTFPFAAEISERTGLTSEECSVVFLLQLQWWNHTLQVIPHIDELPAMERVQFDNGIVARFSSGVGRLFYDHMKGANHPDAVDYVENLLAGPSPFVR